MRIEPGSYTYETIPDLTESVAGACELPCARGAIEVRYVPDVVYRSVDGADLRLQVLQPLVPADPVRRFPCVVFVQGSHWAEQNLYRNVCNLGVLARRGYVCVIVEYRHSGIATFPAQVIDAKHAVRFMRAHADEYHVEPDAIALMGDSSGGHVAVLAGMTARSGELDDAGAAAVPCDVCGIIDLYGAVDPTLPYGFPNTPDHQLASSPEGLLMGFNIRENPEQARIAVATTYVNRDFAPMLICHGTKDKVVACQESIELYEALCAEGKDVAFYLMRGSDHADAGFWCDQAIDVYEAFLRRCLAGDAADDCGRAR